MLHQWHEEMTMFEDMKLETHKELECVYYGLESAADEQREMAEKKYLCKMDDVKSKVCTLFIFTINL